MAYSSDSSSSSSGSGSSSSSSGGVEMLGDDVLEYGAVPGDPGFGSAALPPQFHVVADPYQHQHHHAAYNNPAGAAASGGGGSGGGSGGGAGWATVDGPPPRLRVAAVPLPPGGGTLPHLWQSLAAALGPAEVDAHRPGEFSLHARPAAFPSFPPHPAQARQMQWVALADDAAWQRVLVAAAGSGVAVRVQRVADVSSSSSGGAHWAPALPAALMSGFSAAGGGGGGSASAPPPAYNPHTPSAPLSALLRHQKAAVTGQAISSSSSSSSSDSGSSSDSSSSSSSSSSARPAPTVAGTRAGLWALSTSPRPRLWGPRALTKDDAKKWADAARNMAVGQTVSVWVVIIILSVTLWGPDVIDLGGTLAFIWAICGFSILWLIWTISVPKSSLYTHDDFAAGNVTATHKGWNDSFLPWAWPIEARWALARVRLPIGITCIIMIILTGSMMPHLMKWRNFPDKKSAISIMSDAVPPNATHPQFFNYSYAITGLLSSDFDQDSVYYEWTGTTSVERVTLSYFGDNLATRQLPIANSNADWCGKRLVGSVARCRSLWLSCWSDCYTCVADWERWNSGEDVTVWSANEERLNFGAGTDEVELFGWVTTNEWGAYLAMLGGELIEEQDELIDALCYEFESADQYDKQVILVDATFSKFEGIYAMLIVYCSAAALAAAFMYSLYLGCHEKNKKIIFEGFIPVMPSGAVTKPFPAGGSRQRGY